MAQVKMIVLFFMMVMSLTACQTTNKESTPSPGVSTDDQANALFERIFQQRLANSPEFQTSLGIKTDYDKWDDRSDAFAEREIQQVKTQLQQLKDIDVRSLSPEVVLSYRLMERQLEEAIENYAWRYHDYPVNQMFGVHTNVASLLINEHLISSVADAEAYIKRINNVPRLFEQLIQGLKTRADLGIIPPKFVFPKVISDCENLIKDIPFEQGEGSVIWQDFNSKVNKLNLDQETLKPLQDSLQQALVGAFKPAYENLIVEVKKLETKADDRAGAWKFPRGDEFYKAALKRTTTTDLTADDIHSLGLREVARIHKEMQGLMDKVNFKGSLQEFFVYLRQDEKFYFPNTDEGRQAYLDQTSNVLEGISNRLPELFITTPKSALLVKRVEEFREKSAGKAFYQSPPPDGSRPGIYYVNLYNMRDMPKYELDALLYHEGLPGHHLQLSFATELKNTPNFRKYAGYTAYVEGWGLYAELLPKEIGLYENPYADFGRLNMELWRACRLVTDTGLHAKRWTREQAIQYLVDNTPNTERSSTSAIERYIVMPSQATAYKIGMIKLIELREKSRIALGDKFDIREYHEEVLKLGGVPLDVLEEQVDVWINAKLQGKTS